MATPIQQLGRGRMPVLAPAVVWAILTACGETSVNAPLPASRIEGVASTGLSGPAGQPLPVEVRVFSSDDQPLPGATVTFIAGNGGSVDPASGTSDINGIVGTSWTLGQTIGTNVLTVTSGTVSTTLNATVTAATPATVTLVAGNNQTAPAGTTVPIAPSVRVTDAFDNLVAGAPVSFSPLSGGGNVTGGLVVTNGQGVATVGSWTLGPGAGLHTLAGRVEAAGVSNNPVVFTATATPPAGSQMVATAGNNQTAPVGRLVPIAPTVVVRNQFGIPLPGVSVTFEVVTGGGSVVGSRQLTDATGTATVGGWFLGPTPGANTLRANSTGIAPVTFTATGVAAQPVTMVATSQTIQTAPVGTNVSDPPAVIVRDASGIPVPGVNVAFVVSVGGGSVVGSPVATNENGVARLTSWRLGPLVGQNTVTATATGLSSVTFNATGTAGLPTNVTASAGNNQTARQGTAVPVAPTVRVTDAGGNPVPGVAVTFAVLLGGGSASGLNQVTDALGLASVGSWVLGTGAPNTLRATVAGSGISGNPVTFTAQSATTIVVTAQPAGPLALGANFTITVQLENSAGDPVALSGVSLTISILSGGGTLNGTLTQSTVAGGSASFTNINVTGSAGARTFRITGTGLDPATTASITFN